MRAKTLRMVWVPATLSLLLPPHRAPDGPLLTRPGLLGPCARATTEQPSGQNGHEKNDLEP